LDKLTSLVIKSNGVASSVEDLPPNLEEIEYIYIDSDQNLNTYVGLATPIVINDNYFPDL
jgi:hypothetical protein